MVLRSLTVVALLAAAPLAAADEITVETALAATSVPATPEKLVVFGNISLDTLDALGVDLAGVPGKLYVDYLSDLQDGATDIGSSSEPDFEGIAQMAPDLIVIGGGSSKQMEPLSKIASTIDMFVRGADHVAQMRARLSDFGALTGTEAKAAELDAAFLAQMETAQAAVSGKGRTLILLTNAGKISAYGADSRFGWLYTDVGLVEAVNGIDALTHGEVVSFEFVAEANPDWIIVVDRSAAIGREAEAAAVTLDTPLVAGTTAGQKGQVIYLEAAPAYVTGGGYQVMMSILASLIDGFGAGT